ncbi:5-formyltetrahydrofolate cyclo-ligase [Lentzea sp. NBRC 105346]|uniref:5-formyltetrahydrofolate cyclo-ligase n=1 Tax=Lentzea sp. NBRC 105346 TaxID=3032205 RepID=UPI0024A50399|nr:5-formyltetrahydrofolate cyclo-ligase [Lentzea sp. NBRC 105346]GLZ32071.1 5-formyltetrahydrofolate cyclo-ligase [Lentzea sp. NBRC 105346]
MGGPGEGKNEVRHRVWDLMAEHGAAPPDVHGSIPNFVGAEAAAGKLAELAIWQSARVVKAVPDKPQIPVRVLGLSQGKLIYLAVPKLAGAKPFYELDPAHLPVPPAEAAMPKVAATFARTVDTDEMPQVDLVVCGSVAVDRRGTRLGKGAGYADIEVALLQEAGLIHEATPIVTTVHDLQVVEDELPETSHDFSVDFIITPTQVIECGPSRRPEGILWSEIDPAKVAAIPALALRAAQRPPIE